MSSSNPSNTLDFTRAKLVARIAEVSPRLEPDDSIHSRLMRKLQTTLSINEQIRLFMETLSELIEIEGVRYLNDRPQVHLQSDRLGMHRCHYNLSLPEGPLGEISFGRSKRFLEAELRLIEQMLGILVYPLRNALLYKQAQDTALTDPLTNIGNKRAFDQQIIREMELANRHHGSLSLVLLDLDHFKKINDGFGHVAGDQVLAEVARRISDTCRQSDLCYRLGGEEFAILLSQTDLHGAEIIAERVRKAICAQPVVPLSNISIPVTSSLGISTYRQGDNRDDLVRRADVALYQAKSQGRNRTLSQSSL